MASRLTVLETAISRTVDGSRPTERAVSTSSLRILVSRSAMDIVFSENVTSPEGYCLSALTAACTSAAFGPSGASSR